MKRLHRAYAYLGSDGLGPAPSGEIGNDDRHNGEQEEGRNVGRVCDREGVDRGQEEEVVAQGCGDGGEQRGPKSITHGNADNRREEYQVDVFESECGLDHLADPKGSSYREDSDDV